MRTICAPPLHEPYKELKHSFRSCSRPDSGRAAVSGLHEPYKELKPREYIYPNSCFRVQLHEPYKELKRLILWRAN